MAYDVISPAQLGRGAISTTPTVDTQYTVPALTRAILKTMDITNTSTTTDLDVTVYLVPSGGSPGTANTLISSFTISANGVLQWSGAQVLNPGDTIQTMGSASGLTFNASGAECV